MIGVEPTDETARRERVPAIVMLAGLASLGAGVIHAAAVGVHADAREASLVFIVIALGQCGWGLSMVLAARTTVVYPALAVIGAIGNLALVGGWLVATGSGIGAVEGLEVAVGASTADTLAALLAAVAALAALTWVVAARMTPLGGLGRPVGSVGILGLAALVVAVTVPGLAAASSHADHQHAAGEENDDAGHDDASHEDAGQADADHHDAAPEDVATESVDAAAAAVMPTVEISEVEVCVPVESAAEPTHTHDDSAEHDHDDVVEVVPVCEIVETTAYHPDLPIDLGGMPGVTPQQQAAAENLVAVTLLRLPHFADVQDAIAAGYYSFGDGSTGHEHFLNWDLVDDGRILDPDYPESLVYATRDGERRLVSAMYMLDRTDTLATVPDVGGALMQWHVHRDICMSEDPQPTFAGLRAIGGDCGSGVGFPEIPMIHVWVEPNECGPFAALEGIGAGQVSDGETRLCDHAHGHD